MKREQRAYRQIIFTAIISIIYFMGLVIFPALVYGESATSVESVDNESLNSFDATIHVPDSQADKNLSYFDVKLDPNQEEMLTVTLENKTEKTLTLKASFNRAITNAIGVIEYSGINKDTSKSAPYDIEDLVTLNDKEITLEPHATKDVTLTIKMPDNSFSGLLAGGVYFEANSDEKVEGNVKNIFSREIALLIRSDGEEVKPEVTINSAKAGQENYRNIIEVGIENKAAAYIKDITIDYKVLLDGKEVLKGTNEQLNMAPNTLFPFQIPFSGDKFENGEYQVDIKVSSDQGEWEGKPKFTISEKEASDFNEKDVSIKEDSGAEIPWGTIALIAVLIVLGSVVILMINRNKKLKKELAKKRKKRKKRPTETPKK
ncbi:DUF916 and DUF3324 domain-containing protein [uncultured Enterococcus sp.]|uniref:DUF916 and DUF3324 domain-containing protein n=1 Tax=uncultured Enterococcus sp. TaxID=167972 RepID=UPI002AA70650|nr:DUF916 and DUF3324 domain-containing protein [uncultured Enterococcus sp.]